jgi:nitroimidazol reductase NimA-like FMN-containing flavoprotein (pyridoxamine 5'-phosphate oxidase superfamily)
MLPRSTPTRNAKTADLVVATLIHFSMEELMFRAMRRDEKQLTEAQALALLTSAEEGILATVGADEYPYAIPLNYAYHEGCIYFHCARSGHKLDNIRHNPKVSFCVFADTEVLAAKFSTKFKSVVVFGVAEEVEAEEKEAGLLALIYKYAPTHQTAGEKYIRDAGDKTRVFKIKIEQMTGKGAH